MEGNILKGPTIECSINSHNIGEVFLKVFSENPNHVAQVEVETGMQTTFAEMKENSIRCALWMRKQGIGISDVIAICTDHQLDSYIPCIATFYVGAIYNPWHHEITLRTARHFMTLTRPKLMFSCPSVVNVLMEAASLEKVDTRFIVFGKYKEIETLKDTMRLQTAEEVRTFRSCTIEDPQIVGLIFFTSGTTGLPKGVANTYSAFFHNPLNFKTCVMKSMLWYTPLSWLSSSLFLIDLILSASTRIIHAQFDPEDTCKVIEKYKVNWFFITPSAVIQWCKSHVLKKYELKSLELVRIGGSKLSPDVMEEFKNSLPNSSIIPGYGSTELAGSAMVWTKQCRSIESVGFVVHNTQLKIIDVDNGQPLGPNQPGELCIKSPTMMIGYYNNPSATEAVIDGEGWLHTGDKGYYAENGEVYIVDRLKEVMKFRGHHVSPAELEEILIGHPGVVEAAVVPVPHALDLERPMAFVKKIPGCEVSEDELVELSSVLGDNKKLWGGVKFLEDMPHTPSGKINKIKLKEMAKAYGQ